MKKKIMVVDDSVFIWEEMKRIIKDTDFEIVGCAKSGEQAIEMYPAVQPDVVTMDIILPGLDGIDTSRILLRQWPDAKIVVVSSLAYDETIEQANDAGACSFVFKPFDKLEMLRVLQEAAQ